MLKLDGYDEAILGQATVWQRQGAGAERVDTLIYSGPKIIDILMTRDGMEEDDAYEFFSFNIEGAYMGPDTPIIVWHRPHTEVVWPAHPREES
jgi:hypothetical protein